jgi:hypothetical protein
MRTDFLTALNFLPKNSSINIYKKKYSLFKDYKIGVDLEKKSINFGENIFFNDSKKCYSKNNKR